LYKKRENPIYIDLGSPSMKKKYEKKIEAISVPKVFLTLQSDRVNVSVGMRF
jgi:hypothetical protein